MWTVYLNGKSIYSNSGFYPTNLTRTNCYIGKSNWSSATSQYENKDELFKGKLFDLRGYKVPVSDKMILESVVYGKQKLQVE